MRRLVIIDQKAIIYCGHAKGNIFTLQKGSYIDGKYIIPSIPAGGTAYCLQKIIEFYNKDTTTEFIVCNDTISNFRKELYPAYKTTRKKYKSKDYLTMIQADSDLLSKILKQIGLFSYTKELFEADDLIATAIEQHYNNYDEIQIVAEDSDLNALLRSRISKIGVSRAFQPVIYDVSKRFEYTSILKALEGDNSDDIPKLYMPLHIHNMLMDINKDLIVNKEFVKFYVGVTNISEENKSLLRRNIDLAYMIKDVDIQMTPHKVEIKKCKYYLKDLIQPFISDQEKLKLLKGDY